MTLGVGHGSLTVLTNVSGGLAAGGVSGNGTASVVLTGSRAAIDATLAAIGGLSFTPTANYTGGDTLTVTTNDGGNTGSGGAQTAISTIPITVNALSVVQTQTLTVDVDGDGVADPGDTVTVQDVITNNSGERSPAYRSMNC